MFNVGLGELFVFCIIALIVLGPEQLPQAIRSAMQFYKKIKNLAQHVQNEVEKELQISELQDVMKQELHKIQHTEQHMQQQLDQLHQEIATLHQLKSHPIKTKYLSITPLTEQQHPSFIYIFQQKNIQGKS